VIALSALSLLLAGTGQFLAALRNPRAYPAALACAAVSLMFVAAPLLGSNVRNLDWLFRGLYGLREGGRLPALPSLQQEFGPDLLDRGATQVLRRHAISQPVTPNPAPPK
jgi:hypothetical protein